MTGSVKQEALNLVVQIKQYLCKLKEQGQEVVFFNTLAANSSDLKPEKLNQPISIKNETTTTNSIKADTIQSEVTKQLSSNDFKELAYQVSQCKKCDLANSRKQTVFGEGNSRARLVFVGEAPGADEDKQGQPFVGAAGKLLTKIIASIGLKREDVFICNVLKCRPTGNRNPSNEEITNCRPYLEEQLALINPELICALGTFAAQTLLATTEPISRLRGKQHSFNGMTVIPTFHPAALLYHPQNKRLVWEDMKMIAKLLKLPVQK